MPVSAASILREGIKQLEAAGIEQARADAEWLLSRLVGISPLTLYLDEPPLSENLVERFRVQIKARGSGAPLQYLLGEAEFFGERFLVEPGVFIPRPETEAVVERAIRALRAQAASLGEPRRLLDLGTGSGCIAVTLARAFPACLVVGVELSWEALRTARRNVLRHGMASRVQLVQGRWADSLRGAFDGVISNPPYVASAQVDRLPLEVRQEPRLSLDGGERGFRDVREMIRQAPRVLRPGGIVALECGEDQAEEVAQLASGESWTSRVEPLRDLAGRLRGLLLTRKTLFINHCNH